MNRKSIGNEPIYDARQLGAPRMLVLGFQHMFAMFGATVLVPTLTGLSVSVTLLFAGLGTLLFHLLAKGKVPAFLGSSFAFIGGYAAIAPMLPDAAGNLTVPNTEMLPYACFGVGLRGACIPRPRGALQGLRRQEGHALLPADSHRADHYLHRPVALLERGEQLPGKLAGGHGCNTRGDSLQHLGPGHGEDNTDTPRRHRQLRRRRNGGAGGLHRRARSAVDRPAGGVGRDRVQHFRRRRGHGPAAHGRDNNSAHIPRHRGRAHRRHVRNLLHLRSELHRGPGAAPHAARRRPSHQPGRALRRAGQHHLRREHGRPRAQQGVRPARYPHSCGARHHLLLLPQIRRDGARDAHGDHRRRVPRALRA